MPPKEGVFQNNDLKGAYLLFIHHNSEKKKKKKKVQKVIFSRLSSCILSVFPSDLAW